MRALRRRIAPRRHWAGGLLALCVLVAACGTPVAASLAALARHQQSYAGEEVSTAGTVVRFHDPSGPYFVLQDSHQDRVEVRPAWRVAADLGRRVQVIGRFTIDASNGRVIEVTSVAPLSG